MQAIAHKDVRFYNGKIQAAQPKSGYRAGTDALLLAASLKGKPGTKFLELGCGSGIIMLLVNARIKNCTFTGLERDREMLELATRNTINNDNINIIPGDLANMPKDWHLQFDQVFANPPFFDDAGAVRMPSEKTAPFIAGDLKLTDWIAKMLVALKPRGTGTMIYRADGLEKILHALFGKAGRIRILPIHSHQDKPAKRIIVQFRKGVKSESALLLPLIMHGGEGAERYSARAAQILCGEMPIDMDG